MRKRFYLEDVDFVKLFIEEWNICLNGLDKEIIKLEAPSEDVDLIKDILRRVHSIKGGSSFIGLPYITKLGYEMESTLDAIEKENIALDSGLKDGLISAQDLLKLFIDRLSTELKEYELRGDDTPFYVDFEESQWEEPVLEALKIARQRYKNDKTDADKFNETQEQEESETDILQSDEFKRALSEEMREEFLLENIEHVERIENQLLVQLDKNEQDKELINEMFRVVHSIKGGTGVYLSTLLPESDCFPVVKELSVVAHVYENLLSTIRDKEQKFDKSIVDLSYEVVDYFKKVMDAVASETYDNLPTPSIVEKINESMAYLNNLHAGGEELKKQPEQQSTRANEPQQKGDITQSIRVSQEKLDIMMNTISELLITKNAFLHLSSSLNVGYNIPEMSKELKEIGFNINRISDELQNGIMSMRMVEIKSVFQRMPRIVRDISKSTGKHMELIMQGEETEIDKTIIEQISDPLIHLIRNAADHGIENPDERRSKGKPELGKIALRAYNKNKHVFIEIEDDGNGMDADKIKTKAIEKGFITEAEAERMNTNQLINLIFLPGFSTAQKITEVSGRGVGMDIVKSNIEKIKGNVTIVSELNKGTKMIIQLPLTLAVARGLVVEASGETYIFPLECIIETVKLKMNSIHEFNGKYFACLRGNIIGVQWLCSIFLLGKRDTEKKELNAVIISNGNEKFAIIVEKLKNEQEFVVKTFDGQLASIPGIAGSTLLGNGQVVLIINAADIIQLAKQ